MEEEISLGEIVAILWKGKYIILTLTLVAMLAAALISAFYISPVYTATSLADPSISGTYANEIINHPAISRVLNNYEDPDYDNVLELIQSVDLENQDGYVEVIVRAADPVLAADIANRLGLAILEWSATSRLEKLIGEQEFTILSLRSMDQQIYDTRFSQSPLSGQLLELPGLSEKAFGPQAQDLQLHLATYQEALYMEEESLQESLSMLDRFAVEVFGRMSPEELEIALEHDPAYRALREKQGELLTALFGVRDSIRMLEEGSLRDIDVQEDSFFGPILFRRDQLRSELIDLSIQISQLELNLAGQLEHLYLYEAKIPDQPDNTRWPLNTAVAGVLGLMLSVFIVFLKPQLDSIKEHL